MIAFLYILRVAARTVGCGHGADCGKRTRRGHGGAANTVGRGREIAGVLMAGLEKIRARWDRIKAVRGRGLMIAVELADDAQTSFTIRVHRELARRGYLVCRCPGRTRPYVGWVHQ